MLGQASNMTIINLIHNFFGSVFIDGNKGRHAKTLEKTTTGITINFYNRIILMFAFRFNIVGNLLDRKVECWASYRQGSYFESCVLRAMSSHSSHNPQFNLYVHKGGLKPHSFINSFN